MRVDWKYLSSDSHSAEVQLWEPDEKSEKLIIFCTGFPGVGAGNFEQRHAAALVESGYSLAVIRHAGTRFETPYAPLMINNGARLMQARQRDEKLLGSRTATIEDWLREPLTVLKSLESAYATISVIGNSFGALSAFWSLTRKDAPLSKIDHLVLQAGAQGIHKPDMPDDIMRIWTPENIGAARITEKVDLESPQAVSDTLRQVYLELPARVMTLPDHIKFTYIVVMQDEILKPFDTENFRAATGGRGNVIVDDFDKAYLSAGLIAHDMPDWPTERFLEIIGR